MPISPLVTKIIRPELHSVEQAQKKLTAVISDNTLYYKCIAADTGLYFGSSADHKKIKPSLQHPDCSLHSRYVVNLSFPNQNKELDTNLSIRQKLSVYFTFITLWVQELLVYKSKSNVRVR